MSRRRPVPARPGRRGADDPDAGFTLVEIMVSMSLMSVVMVLFTGAVLQMYSSYNKASGLVDAATQVNTAFARIDRQVRYASDINAPGLGAVKADGTQDWYVEWDNTTSGTDQCTQLRISDGLLQERSWTGTPTSPPGYTTLASGILTPTTTPFVWSAAGSAQAHERLQLVLTARSGPDRDAATSATAVTFSAMNSGQGVSVTNDGSTLVCQSGVDRS